MKKYTAVWIVLAFIAGVGVLMLFPQTWRFIRNDREESKTPKELINDLGDSDPGIRMDAARELGRSGGQGENAISALAQRLSDEIPDVRVQAALALTKLELTDNSIVVPLSKALSDEIKLIRWDAVQCLQRLGPNAKAAVPAL